MSPGRSSWLRWLFGTKPLWQAWPQAGTIGLAYHYPRVRYIRFDHQKTRYPPWGILSFEPGQLPSIAYVQPLWGKPRKIVLNQLLVGALQGGLRIIPPMAPILQPGPPLPSLPADTLPTLQDLPTTPAPCLQPLWLRLPSLPALPSSR